MSDAHHDESITSFMTVTGADTAIATQYLTVSNWEVAKAVNLYMENGGSSLAGASGSMDTNHTSVQNPPPPIRSTRTAAAAPSSSSMNPNTSHDEQLARQLASSMEDDDVRAPDPSRKQRLMDDDDDDLSYSRIGLRRRITGAEEKDDIDAINATFMEDRGGFGEEGLTSRSSLTSMFRPPLRLLYRGTFSSAMKAAKEQGKWLLVNIQDETVFTSHMLNRDTWSDDIVQNVVESGFVFWQNYWSNEPTRKYISLYPLQREELPHIAIIDPRSGQRLAQWTGFLSPQDLTEKLSDFCDQHPIPEGHASTAAPTPAEQQHHNPFPSGEGISEDAQLAAAIAASLEENSGASNEVINVDESEEGKDETHEEEEETKEEELDPEPAAGTAGVTRIQIRAPDGKRLIRRFLKTEPVSHIWTFIRQEIPESRRANFEVRTAIPPANIDYSTETTIEEAKLANASLLIQWSEK